MSAFKVRLAGAWHGPPVLMLVLVLFALASPARLKAEAPAAPEAKNDKLKELQKERLAALREAARLATARFQNAQGSLDEVREAARKVAEAELDLCDSDKERVAVLEKFVGVAKKYEEQAAQFAKAGKGREYSALMAKADRLEAEIALEQAKAKAAAQPGTGKTAPDADEVALAEKQVAMKRAALKVAEAETQIAAAKLASAKAQLVQAQATESYQAKRLKRMEELYAAMSIDERVVDEAREQVEAAKARGAMAEGAVAEAEAQVALEQARVELSRLEVEYAELRLKQLKGRQEPKP
jgi:hypothetical protein